MKISTLRRLKARTRISVTHLLTRVSAPFIMLLVTACGGSGSAGSQSPAAADAGTFNLAAMMAVAAPGESDDAPHDEARAPTDDGDPVLAPEDDSPRRPVDPGDFAMQGYGPGWTIVTLSLIHI